MLSDISAWLPGLGSCTATASPSAPNVGGEAGGKEAEDTHKVKGVHVDTLNEKAESHLSQKQPSVAAREPVLLHSVQCTLTPPGVSRSQRFWNKFALE